jgi:DNA-binding transcriptional MocR family regulator
MLKKKRSPRSDAPPTKKTPADAVPASEWMPDLRSVEGTKYLSLYDAITEAIDRGQLKAGERLPTQRALAAALGVNIVTISKAIAEAGRRGILVTRRGGGTYVAAPDRASGQMVGPESGTTDLSINIPPIAPVRAILDETIGVVARRHNSDTLLGYSTPGGAFHDREVASTWIATRGLDVAPDKLILTHGAYEGLFGALAALTRPGDVVACEGINYTGIRRLGELCGLKLVGVDVDERGMRADSLASILKDGKAKAIVCTPVTLNPTTATQDAERRKAIVDLAKQHSVPIVEDDIYGQLAGDRTPPMAAYWPQGVIYISGLSKCIAAGLRVGYLYVPDPFRSRARDALLRLSWTAPSFHIAISTELIRSGHAAACAAAHRTEALKRMQLARKILRELFVPKGDVAAYHGWMRVPEPWQEQDATAAFRRHGILVSPAHDFVIGARATPSAIRLGLGGVEDINVLERALVSIADLLIMRPAGLSSIA